METRCFRNAPYAELLELQRSEFKKRVDCRINHWELPEDLLLMVEHLPVYTLGFHGNADNFLEDVDELRRLGIDIVRIERGGDITYHGPGQLTVYPIIDMLRYRLGVKDYVYLLEESVIRTIGEYGITGERVEGATGVWVVCGDGKRRKISAIGVKCSRHVAMHGLALNISSDISGFRRINPCGFDGDSVTSLSLLTGREENFERVRSLLEGHLRSLLEGHISCS